MGRLHLAWLIAGLACAGVALDARAQALRGYGGGDGDSGQAALRGYVPPAPSSDDSSSQSSGSDNNDWPRDADDDRPSGWRDRDNYDHSLPAGPQYGSPQENASAQQVYAQPAYAPPRDPIDVARANCAALHQRLETVMRAEMQGGNPAAMKQYAAERAAIYQQEMQIGCE